MPRESTLEFVAGSHLGPWLMPRTFMAGEAKWFPEGTLADLPDIEADRDAFPILGWALEPGDAVFFNMLTFHAAGAAPAAAAPSRCACSATTSPTPPPLDDVAGVSWARGRAARRCADGPPAVPGGLGAR